jgi:hypothetical protein
MTDANPLAGQTKSRLLTVPIEPGYNDVIETGARLENRTQADYVRNCLLRDLLSKGLVDSRFLPISTVEPVDG